MPLAREQGAEIILRSSAFIVDQLFWHNAVSAGQGLPLAMKRWAILGALLFQASPPPCVPASVVNVQSAINAALGISCALTPTPQVDVFTSSAPFPPFAPFVLSRVPIGSPALPAPMVYLNGVLQVVSVDYQIAGQTLAFTATDLGDSPKVQVIYWYAQ